MCAAPAQEGPTLYPINPCFYDAAADAIGTLVTLGFKCFIKRGKKHYAVVVLSHSPKSGRTAGMQQLLDRVKNAFSGPFAQCMMFSVWDALGKGGEIRFVGSALEFLQISNALMEKMRTLFTSSRQNMRPMRKMLKLLGDHWIYMSMTRCQWFDSLPVEPGQACGAKVKFDRGKLELIKVGPDKTIARKKIDVINQNIQPILQSLAEKGLIPKIEGDLEEMEKRLEPALQAMLEASNGKMEMARHRYQCILRGEDGRDAISIQWPNTPLVQEMLKSTEDIRRADEEFVQNWEEAQRLFGTPQRLLCSVGVVPIPEEPPRRVLGKRASSAIEEEFLVPDLPQNVQGQRASSSNELVSRNDEVVLFPLKGQSKRPRRVGLPPILEEPEIEENG